MSKRTKQEMRQARHRRLRKKVFGTPERPRLAVYRSLRHISAQVIDDTTGRTLCSASTMEKEIEGIGNVAGAREVGRVIAERAKALGIKAVVLDRGGFRYHGAVASLADGAREEGLEF